MAALLIPTPAHEPRPLRRPHLTLVPSPVVHRATPLRPLPASVYRRRRIGVVLALATLLVLVDHATNAVVRALTDPPVAAVVAAPPAAAATPPVVAAVPVTRQELVVQPGDTLWTLARSLQPTGEIRPLVDELARRAGGSSLRAGQRLDVTGLTGAGG